MLVQFFIIYSIFLQLRHFYLFTEYIYCALLSIILNKDLELWYINNDNTELKTKKTLKI